MNSDSRTVFGETSSRPELQCPAAATVQQFDDREWKSNLFKNLSQCTDVIHQEEYCSSALKEAGFASPETSFLLQLEKSLLDIALPALSDGTFYCSLFKIENNCYCRFFECGVLEGYFLAEGIRYVKSYMEENFDNISTGKFIWFQVSTPEHITQYHQRYAKRLDRKRSDKAIKWKSNLFKNLSQCTDVIHQEEHCSSALKEAGFASPETSFLLQLEKSLLDIALPALSDGTFYCSLFKIENNCYCRFFECGVLEGYVLAEGIRYVKSYMEENFDNISMGKFIWCQVSTPEDITQYHQRYAKRLDRKRSDKAISQPSADIGRRFNYLMTKNKGSVVNAHRNLLTKAQTLSPTSENLQFLRTVLHVIKKNSHKETNQLLARYHDATGTFRSASHTWENSFQQYRVNGVPQHPPEFSSLLDTPRSSHFTWHEKCMIISAFPNNHYWDEVDQAHVGYARMLSVRDEIGKKKPASLRNLILLHCRDKDFGTIYQLVKRYKNPATETSAIQSTVNQFSNYTDVSQPEEQRSVRTRRKALTEEDILRNLTILNPDFIEENRSTENSLYQQYKTAQIESGTLQWRLHKPHIDILCMDDINMNTGTIYDFFYVHMTRTLEGNELHYNCTCKLYATLLQLATLNDNLDAEIYDVNIRCCHIRLFKEVIEPIFVNIFTPESMFCEMTI
ncbi:unnamed protein product [Mytilus coruscus]|uniref:Uncharacterized protein n=1 Tax=Mytilus coruscus TaxID=42192 RepID=A0A6J8BCI7_MYTCO|nr:unnamed protein product [Mytilus coruscus]